MTSRAKMVEELVEGGIKPTSQTDHALAAMRKAMEKARGTRNVASENGKSSSDEDGETRATPKRRRLKVEQVLTAPPRYEESLELTALKERLHALENKQDDHGQARRPDESTGSFDQPNAYVLSNRQTLIEEFAMNNHLVKATVAKIAGGYYCEIYECAKFSSVRSQASLSTSSALSSSSGPGTTTLVAATKKVVIPQCFRDFSGPITVLMKARKLFSVVGHESDSEYVDFIRDTAFHVLHPPGVFALDRLVRQTASQRSLAWWPIPDNLALCASLLVSPHTKPAAYCSLCGDLSHLAQLCPLSDSLEAPGIADRRMDSGGSTRTKHTQLLPCGFFMRKTGNHPGVCTPPGNKTCNRSHKCPSCNGQDKHRRNCSRP